MLWPATVGVLLAFALMTSWLGYNLATRPIAREAVKQMGRLMWCMWLMGLQALLPLPPLKRHVSWLKQDIEDEIMRLERRHILEE